jgi:hypothetical protein
MQRRSIEDLGFGSEVLFLERSRDFTHPLHPAHEGTNL